MINESLGSGKKIRLRRWRYCFLAIWAYFSRYCGYALCYPLEAPSFSHSKNTTAGIQCPV